MARRTDQATTGIEWTDHTWNPFTGCTIHTAGCTNCYAMRTAFRLEHQIKVPHYAGTTKMANGNPVWTGKVNRASSSVMKKPFKIKKPSLIFVNSMSDFFHESALDDWRLEVLDIIRQTPHHYQILTKRPEQIQPFMDRAGATFPENAWIGATIESSKYLERVDILRTVTANIRFLSVEPLIAPLGPVDLNGIDWVIIGGESGPGAREMRYEWVREVLDQCYTQGCPVFFKQWGRPENNPIYQQGGAKALKEQDPVGKGGCLVDGHPFKHFPAGISIAA